MPIDRDITRISEASGVLVPLGFGSSEPVALSMAELIAGLEAAQLTAPFHAVHVNAAVTGLRALEQSAWAAANPPIGLVEIAPPDPPQPEPEEPTEPESPPEPEEPSDPEEPQDSEPTEP